MTASEWLSLAETAGKNTAKVGTDTSACSVSLSE